MKVLVVDTDPSLAEAIRLGFAPYWPGLQVFSIADGAAGWALFRRETPDLTLVDVYVPHAAAWLHLTEEPARAGAPVLLLTSPGQRPGAMPVPRGRQVGYLPKPFGHQELVAHWTALRSGS